MFELCVEREFCAAHAIVMGGVREIVHGHNFRVSVCVGGERLDADGLLVDFHALEGLVDRILKPFVNADLNSTSPFDRVNPTAERIAEHIGMRVKEGLGAVVGKSGTSVRLKSVRVTEAPGCGVTFIEGE